MIISIFHIFNTLTQPINLVEFHFHCIRGSAEYHPLDLDPTGLRRLNFARNCPNLKILCLRNYFNYGESTCELCSPGSHSGMYSRKLNDDIKAIIGLQKLEYFNMFDSQYTFWDHDIPGRSNCWSHNQHMLNFVKSKLEIDCAKVRVTNTAQCQQTLSRAHLSLHRKKRINIDEIRCMCAICVPR